MDFHSGHELKEFAETSSCSGTPPTHNTMVSMATTADTDRVQRLETQLEPSDDDPAYVVKFKSTLRTDLETLKQNANIAYVKTAAALEPDSRSSSVYPDLTELTEGTEGCWRETCGSHQRKSWPCWLLHQSVIVNRRKTQLRTVWWIQSRAHHQYRGLSCSKHAAPVLGHSCNICTCESLFSVAAHIVQKKRVSLSSENVNELVCLSSWLGAEEEENVKSEEDKMQFMLSTQPGRLKVFFFVLFLTEILQRKSSTNTHFTHSKSYTVNELMSVCAAP